MGTEKIVAIFGSGKAQKGSDAFKLAEKIGGLLAKEQITIINGGYGGTMLAAAKSAADAGGKVIGVTCSAFGNASANIFTSQEIVTANLDERLDKLTNIPHAFIVLPGSTGTLLELAKVWELKNKGFIKTEKPIILIGSFWKPLVKLIAQEDPDCIRFIHQADSAEDALEILRSFFKHEKI